MVKQSFVVTFASLVAQTSATGCWNSQCTNAAGDWGWCENCDGGSLTGCCAPQYTTGCVDGKNCRCTSYGHCGTVSSANESNSVAVTAEVRGDGCWNQHAADPAGNWGWCEHCSSGLTQCCTADKTYGCVNGQNCQCSSYNIPDGMSQALYLATEAEVRVDEEQAGCWNSQCTNAAGDWGWCENCGSLSTCCPPQYTYGCVDGKNCKCSSYGHCGTGSSANKSSTSLALAAEVRGDGCWNQHAADAAGNWGWCEHCSGGKLTVCCTPDKAIDCVNGQNCKCSPSNKPDGVSQALAFEV